MSDPTEQITNASAFAAEAYDPAAARARQRNWATQSRELAKQRNREHIQRIKLERGCTDCGYRKHPDALDFDHLPEHGKTIAVGMLAASGASIKRLDDEIARCEVVCANCHRIRTSGRAKARFDQNTGLDGQPDSEVAS
ncbi:hypothetical protein [Couchioplanes caeruleus]|uniref:HNH endonuclease n=2 Tax=Couchioplanes caeruleus TaxID=56438 RepID=A0A1K0FP49_9ACTN|nr:hypothetical protein [Couchioplanes caeruleus]OJF14480.1 hypothetical protein BG844_09580 [Couchioplanes caeruleus subsp. caeruleus]